MTADLLELRDVAVDYSTAAGMLPVVRGVSLRLGAGQVLGLAGESGCGKTSLALSVLRLLPGTARVSGEISLDGHDVPALNWGQLRAVRWTSASVVFQGAQHALNPMRRVAHQVAEPLRRHRPGLRRAEIGERVAALLDQVGLASGRAYPHELSGGQRQRATIAMALACEPRLVIADEPTSALDTVTQAQVLALLADLVARQRIALWLISHDLAVLGAHCDRLAVMYAGRVVESGPVGDVLSAPAHPYTAGLVAAFPTVGDPASRLAPRGLPGDPPHPSRLPAGCAFHPRCPVAVPQCVRGDVALRDIRDARGGHRAACVHLPGPG